MTQYVPADLTENETGDELGDILTGTFRALRTGQAGTAVPGTAEKGFAYTKLDGSGNIVGLFIAKGDGTDQDASPPHILAGITDAAEARDRLGVDDLDIPQKMQTVGVAAYGLPQSGVILNNTSDVLWEVIFQFIGGGAGQVYRQYPGAGETRIFNTSSGFGTSENLSCLVTPGGCKLRWTFSSAPSGSFEVSHHRIVRR